MRRRARAACFATSVVLALASGGCAGSIPAVPPGARAQAPAAGAPATPWIARDGRFELSAGDTQITATATVQRLANGQLRLGLQAGDGRVLADVHTTSEGIQVTQLDVSLTSVRQLLSFILHQAWSAPADAPKWVDGWIIGQAEGAERLYGGDPLVLRRVSTSAITGDGIDLAVEDYRWEAVGLIAHEARLATTGISMRVVLGPVTAPAASIPPSAVAKPNLGNDRW